MPLLFSFVIVYLTLWYSIRTYSFVVFMSAYPTLSKDWYCLSLVCLAIFIVWITGYVASSEDLFLFIFSSGHRWFVCIFCFLALSCILLIPTILHQFIPSVFITALVLSESKARFRAQLDLVMIGSLLCRVELTGSWPVTIENQFFLTVGHVNIRN